MSGIRILLVEPAADEARFLEEALAEIQEGAAQGCWTAFDVVAVGSPEDARDFALADPPDIILMSAEAHAGGALDALNLLREASPEVAVVMLLSRRDESAGVHLLRAGAQDYLIKEEVECAPLERSIRNAIERQKVVNALRRSAAFDELTGMYNERGFHTAVERELHLAGLAHAPMLLVLAEIDGDSELSAACGRSRRDLAVLSAAEALQASGGKNSLLCFLNGRRFVAVCWERQPEEFINSVEIALGGHPRDFALRFGWACSAADEGRTVDELIAEAEARLCENEASLPDVSPSRSTQHTRGATNSQG